MPYTYERKINRNELIKTTMMGILIDVIITIFNLRISSELELPGFHFQVLIKFKGVYAALWVINCFPPYNPFPTNETL